MPYRCQPPEETEEDTAVRTWSGGAGGLARGMGIGGTEPASETERARRFETVRALDEALLLRSLNQSVLK